MKSKTYTVPYRRKREGKTNYKKRLNQLKAALPRLVVRKSLQNLVVQLVNYTDKGDKVLVGVSSSQLKKLGWNYSGSSMPAAYLTGFLAAQKAKAAGVKEAILDLGLQPPIAGSKLYAALKGAVDNELDVHSSEEILPSDERVKGEHIAKYAEAIKSDQDKYNKQFSAYAKNNADPTQIPKVFDEVKDKISKM